MIPRSPLVMCAVGLVMLIGCAYYNGLYNANRLAAEAKRAAREGRPAEARSLWSQAAVKAESVAARYPDSKYLDDALLLQGRALWATDDCAAAVGPLEEAIEASPDSSIRADARMLLGQCRFTLGDHAAAAAVLDPLTRAVDSSIAMRALLWQGKALLAAGTYDSAVTVLAAQGETEAYFSLSVAYTRLGRPTAAEEALLHEVMTEFDEVRWLAVLDTVGSSYPATASAVIDRLVQRADLTSGQKGRLLLADGERWLASGDPGRAEHRFDHVVELAPDSIVSREARARRVLAETRMVSQVGALPGLVDSLEATRSERGAEEDDLGRLAAVLHAAVAALDGHSSDEEIGGAHRDLRLFISAEAMRDMIDAPAAAAALFMAIRDSFPDSPIAPKALLAVAWLQPACADSVIAILHQRYPTSPYTQVLTGGGGDRYTAVEDSLRTLLRTLDLPISKRQ
jgi:tetratricopeptide (TPR) repeat protein